MPTSAQNASLLCSELATQAETAVGTQRLGLFLTSLKGDQALWTPDQFTDPKMYDPKNFTYLIHSLNGTGPIDWKAAEAAIGKNGLLSTSLISNKRPTTFDMSGFILSAPPHSIYAAAPKDFYSKNYLGVTHNPKEILLSEYKQVGLLSPERLLKKTEKGEYNEVLVDGTDGVKASGIFVVTYRGKVLINADRMKEIEQFSKDRHLPIVYIEYKP